MIKVTFDYGTNEVMTTLVPVLPRKGDTLIYQGVSRDEFEFKVLGVKVYGVHPSLSEDFEQYAGCAHLTVKLIKRFD